MPVKSYTVSPDVSPTYCPICGMMLSKTFNQQQDGKFAVKYTCPVHGVIDDLSTNHISVIKEYVKTIQTVQQVELTDECIDKLAKRVVELLKGVKFT